FRSIPPFALESSARPEMVMDNWPRHPAWKRLQREGPRLDETGVVLNFAAEDALPPDLSNPGPQRLGGETGVAAP
ncbi:MAG: hypothetical protein LC633_04725, partial [Desulfobulbaceae bacterium]|nr:hypothetical protein [Desulfobulbaceae bacterium]